MNKGAQQARDEANNAPWLTIAHVICTDAGIAHGPISGRLEALRDKLADKAQQTTEETDAEMALRSIASWLGVGGFNAPTVDAKVFEQKIYEGVEMAIKSHYATAEEPELPEAAETLQIPDTALGRDYGSITKVIFHLSMAKREPGWLVGACWLASSILERIKALGPLYTAVQMHAHYQAGVRAGAAQMEARKDAAYLERNRVVAALAKCFPSGIARTAIEGWSEDWHGCVYIDLPTGQVSWHFHDSHAFLFEGLPAYVKPWDGHDTAEKYRRVAALCMGTAGSQDAKRLDWVESQGNGSGWLARNSITNRGYRIHNDKDAKHKTVREAIDSAMQGDSQ